MILLASFVYVAAGLLGFLLLAGYIELSERWMDSRRAYPSAVEFLVFITGGTVLIGIYIALMAPVVVWAGLASV